MKRMIVIIKGSRTWVQWQLNDFARPRSRMKINLRTKLGRSLYEAIFQRKPRRARKHRRDPTADRKVRTLEEFIKAKQRKAGSRGSRGVHLPHHHKPRVASHGEFAKGKICELELAALENYQNCTGYLGHIFALEDFAGFESAVFSLKQERTFGSFQPVDILKLEIARCKLGYDRYGSWMRYLDTTAPIMVHELQLECNTLPAVKHYSAMVAALGSSNLFSYFQYLVEQEIRFGLVDLKLGIWDARFVGSNCSGTTNKANGKLYDPDAGKRLHKSSYKGAGYSESIIYDGLLGRKVDFEVYPANDSDKLLYRRTYSHYVEGGGQPFQYMVADGGAGSSVKNNEVTLKYGTIPILRWKKSSQPYIIKIGKYYFDTRAIPKHMLPYLAKFYRMRTTCERTNSPDDWVYRRDRMPNRGIENANIFIGVTNITEKLDEITSFKVGRPDLIRSPTVFRQLGARSPLLLPRYVDRQASPLLLPCGVQS